GVQAVVVGVAAGGCRGDDAVGDVAVVHEVVHTGDRDGLGDVPVARGEGGAGRRDRTLGGVVGGQPDGHVGSGCRVEHHREGGRAARFAGVAADGRHGDAGRVSFPTRRSSDLGVQAVVVGVVAGGCRGDDAVGDVAVV